MPRRTDIGSIMVIGAGPIVIGQACEFDYSGTQACKALKDEGYRVILVNSNPATIMTDPEFADATYIEPITPDIVGRIVAAEKPDALLPTMGGQTALNTALALANDGTLARHGVDLIGASQAAIEVAEDREAFREAMKEIGLECPKSRIARSLDEARQALDLVGLPTIIRPSYTLGGTGGGIAYNRAEFAELAAAGIAASPAGQILVEESVLGWKEFEMEVVRDKADNAIIVCSIENLDPMGIHTGDSITVAPALTLTDKEYQLMRNAAIAVLRKVGVETGGSNVQFAVDPATGRLLVIEMNPRVSRSSALASKATGFPIAKVAARLAVGYTLDEIANDITGVTPASFEPAIDYVVTKVPRFAFEKFPGAEPLLTTSMKSVGEAMAIGRTFCESLQKALRSMETGLTGLDEIPIPGADESDHEAILATLGQPRPDRLLVIAEALRRGVTIEAVHRACAVDPWFLREIEVIVRAEAEVRANGLPGDADALRRLKALGFGDRRLATLADTDEAAVAAKRNELGVHPVFKRIDTCAAEFESRTPYMYSCYETASGDGLPECEAEPSDRRKVVILGGGPNRIGQGIEFDYCCVHAAYALKDAGFETIMVNCNPETVSTDYDTSDRLYFEPLTIETVLDIVPRRAERRRTGRPQHPVRRADAAQACQGAGGGWGAHPRYGARCDRPGRGPGPFPDLAGRPGTQTAPRTRPAPPAQRRAPSPSASATPSWSAPPTCSAGAPWRSSTTARSSIATCATPPRPSATARSCSIATSRTQSRSTSMRSPTVRTWPLPESWSTSRRQASTLAIRPARCPPIPWTKRSWKKSAARPLRWPARSTSAA